MRLISAGTALVLILGMVGCGTTSTSKGASLGALVGGLSNGIGGAAVGALVGGGVGYLADSADDKKVAQQQAERRTQALERSSISNNPQTTYRPVTTNRLLGTTWRLISIVADDEETYSYSALVATFQTDSKLTSLVLYNDGRSQSYVDVYRVVDDVLIITSAGEVTNAKYSVTGEQLIVVAPGLRMVLERVQG
jgi:hypothetical protein